MPGRHTAGPSRRAARRPSAAPFNRAGAAVVAGAILVSSVVGWSMSPFGGGSPCHDDDRLIVAAAPEVAPVVEAVLAQPRPGDGGTDSDCLDVESAEPDDVLVALDAGVHAPDVWIPDTSAWLSRLPALLRDRPRWSFAKTPVVLAGPSGAERPPTWLAALSGPGATMLDPRASGASVGALAALQGEAVRGASTGTELSTWLVSEAQAAPDYTPADAELLSEAADGGGAEVPARFPTTEQRFIQQADEISGSGLTSTVPRSGTTLLDYPLVPVVTGAGSAAAVEAAKSLAGRLSAPAGARRLAEAGFRPPSGAPVDAPRGVGPVTEIAVVQPNAIADLLRTWVTLTADARLLTVLDVSGSMNDRAGADTRIALSRDAVLATLADLPDSWQMGLWSFSLRLGPADVDHRVLAPVFDLDATSSGTTHRERLEQAARRLPALVDGGTALYDTALAAYRNAMAGYDPNRSNSVVLLTDGRNEDPDGMTLDHLLERLARAKDPARPVQLIAIGMGSRADTGSLRRIAEVTGGQSYVAEDPRDLRDILRDALLERVGWGLR